MAFYNGRSSFLTDVFLSGEHLQLSTDSWGGIAFGALCGHEWFCGLWPATLHSVNTSVLVLYPIRVAVHIWGGAWAKRMYVLSWRTKPSFPSLTTRLYANLSLWHYCISGISLFAFQHKCCRTPYTSPV